MCLAIPGRIVKINGNEATVDYGGQQRKAGIIQAEYCIGDYVIVQNKIIVKKIPLDEAKESIKLFKK